MTNTAQVQQESVLSNMFLNGGKGEAKIIVIFCGTRNLYKSEVDFKN